MKAALLKEALKDIPDYADVLIDTNEEFRDFTVEPSDHYPDKQTMLVTITPHRR